MSAIRITQSVGQSGVNNPADVKAIQTALNKLLKLLPSINALVVDGRLGSRPENSKTVAAIKQFQSKVVGIVRPDGKIDPNGRTHKKINEKLVGSVNANLSLVFSSKGVELLKSIERFRRKPYDDQTGEEITAWVEGATIGYGHLITESEWQKYSTPITESDALILFKNDLAPFVSLVKRHVTVPLTQYQFDALVLLVFNIGDNFKFSSVLKLINDPNAITSYSSLEQAWRAWNKSQGEVMKGLNNRRNSEWNIYTKGIYKGW